jgi:hypothetical protein
MNLSSENFRKFFGAISGRDRCARLRNVYSESGQSKTSPALQTDENLEQDLTDSQNRQYPNERLKLKLRSEVFVYRQPKNVFSSMRRPE